MNSANKPFITTTDYIIFFFPLWLISNDICLALRKLQRIIFRSLFVYEFLLSVWKCLQVCKTASSVCSSALCLLACTWAGWFQAAGSEWANIGQTMIRQVLGMPKYLLLGGHLIIFCSWLFSTRQQTFSGYGYCLWCFPFVCIYIFSKKKLDLGTWTTTSSWHLIDSSPPILP